MDYLQAMIEDYGIYAIIIARAGGNVTLMHNEIKQVKYHPLTGGIFYKLIPNTQVIPVTDRQLYLGPTGIVQIAFNERKRTTEEKALDDLPY